MHYRMNVKDRKYYCDVLRIKESASQTEIKRAYHALARKHHPDLNGDDPFATDRFQLIGEAYEYLQLHPYEERSLVPQSAAPIPERRKNVPPSPMPIKYNQAFAIYALAFAILVAAGTALFLNSSQPQAELMTASSSSLTSEFVGQALAPPQAAAMRDPAALSQSLLVKFSRKGALGNLISRDNKTGKCPGRSFPASFDEKDQFLSGLCVKKFIDADTVIQDVQIVQAGSSCESGYSHNASFAMVKAKQQGQSICVKTAFPADAQRAVVRLYEADQRKGCAPADEQIGSQGRRIFCQVLAKL